MLSLERWIDPLTESNCYLLGENGRAVVIDPNHPRGPLELLERLGWKPELILLTHEHCDHMAGLEALRRRWPGVPAAATAVCSANLQDKRLNMTQRMEVYLTFRGKPGVSYPPFVCAPAELEGRPYLLFLFDGGERHAKALRKANDPAAFLDAAAAIFRDLPLREDSAGGWRDRPLF